VKIFFGERKLNIIKGEGADFKLIQIIDGQSVEKARSEAFSN